MRILITGGAGYIGTSLTSFLLFRGYQVTVYDSLMYGAESLLPFWDHPNFRLVNGTVLDEPKFHSAVADHDAVVHLAAIVGEEACKQDEDMAWRVNFSGTLNALEAARSAGAKLILASTCSNYGVSDPEVLANEETPLRPNSSYAKAKVAAENLLFEEKMGTILRFGTACGLSGRTRFDLIVNEMALAAVTERVFNVYKPLAWRPFAHVSDIAEAILVALKAPLLDRVYNVVGQNLQKKDLCDLVKVIHPSAKIAITDKAPDRRDYRVSGQRFEQRTFFYPKRTVHQAMKETADALRWGVFKNPEALTNQRAVRRQDEDLGDIPGAVYR